MFSINRAWSTPKSMLSLDGRIEVKNNHPAEAIFLKIMRFGSDKQSITILLDAHALRALMHAALELRHTGSVTFKKFTESNGTKNILTLAADGNAFYLNLEQRRDEQSLKLSHLFGNYSLLAFADTVKLFCDAVENAVFAAQSSGGRHGAQ